MEDRLRHASGPVQLQFRYICVTGFQFEKRTFQHFSFGPRTKTRETSGEANNLTG